MLKSVLAVDYFSRLLNADNLLRHEFVVKNGSRVQLNYLDYQVVTPICYLVA